MSNQFPPNANPDSLDENPDLGFFSSVGVSVDLLRFPEETGILKIKKLIVIDQLLIMSNLSELYRIFDLISSFIIIPVFSFNKVFEKK